MEKYTLDEFFSIIKNNQIESIKFTTISQLCSGISCINCRVHSKCNDLIHKLKYYGVSDINQLLRKELENFDVKIEYRPLTLFPEDLIA